MPQSRDEWRDGFRSYATACRANNPLPSRSKLTDAEEWQCRYVGGSLLNWLKEEGPRLLGERTAMSTLLKVDPEPLVVFVSNVPGLVAAREILGPNHDRVICLSEDERRSLPAALADADHRWHVYTWSYFSDQLEPSFAAKACARHPLPEGSIYWRHTVGTRWAVNAGRGSDHLWRWDGREPELLEEAMIDWVE